MAMEYVIRRAAEVPALEAAWDGPAWRRADVAELTHFRPEGSDHRPRVRVRMLYGADGLYGKFRVEDRYVRSVARNFQDMVCLDSCVEFFVQPRVGRGYCNLEMNCGGTMLLQQVIDPRRTPNGFAEFRKMTVEEAAGVRVCSSMPPVVEPEIAGPVDWELGFFLPFALLRETHGQPAPVPGEVWHANFYKCGDATSHPHWGSWSPVRELNFHVPECFAPVRFE